MLKGIRGGRWQRSWWRLGAEESRELCCPRASSLSGCRPDHELGLLPLELGASQVRGRWYLQTQLGVPLLFPDDSSIAGTLKGLLLPCLPGNQATSCPKHSGTSFRGTCPQQVMFMYWTSSLQVELGMSISGAHCREEGAGIVITKKWVGKGRRGGGGGYLGS